MKSFSVTTLLVVLASAGIAPAQIDSGSASWSSTASLALSTQIALSAPTNTSTLTAPGSVSLVPSPNLQDLLVAWVDRSSNEDGFEIQRQMRIGRQWGDVITVGTTGADATSFVDTPGMGTFRYRVRAFNASGTSSWSKWATVRIR